MHRFARASNVTVYLPDGGDETQDVGMGGLLVSGRWQDCGGSVRDRQSSKVPQRDDSHQKSK